MVEILIVIVVIGILAAITIVTYGGVQRRAASVSAQDAAKDAAEMVDVEKAMGRSLPASLPASFSVPDNIEVIYTTDVFVRYGNLTPVQNGVLFYTVCQELTADTAYRTIHAKSGGGTQSVLYDCSQNINDTNLMINGWSPTTWHVPVTEANIQAYIDSVPYDSWWTDKQAVVRSFFTELMKTYKKRGGTWPITSFWEPDANPYWGTPKEELPEVTSDMNVESYCIQVTHKKYPSMSYYMTPSVKSPQEGTCA